MAAGPKQLMLVPNWHHALPPELNEEPVYAWLDAHLQGKPLALEVSPVTVKDDGGQWIARWSFRGDGQSSDLIASYGEAGNWAGRYWHTFNAKIAEQSCKAELPTCTLPCYLSGSVTAKNGIRCSTPLVRVDGAISGVQFSNNVPDYDGCAEWGSFEEPQIAYLSRHDRSGQKRWIPRVSRDARQGQQSAILNPGTTPLAPILSTAMVKHRLTCFLKADKPVEVTVQLAGERRAARIETEWTEVGMDFTPPNELVGGLFANITIPAEAKVLIDAVSFRPVSVAN